MFPFFEPLVNGRLFECSKSCSIPTIFHPHKTRKLVPLFVLFIILKHYAVTMESNYIRARGMITCSNYVYSCDDTKQTVFSTGTRHRYVPPPFRSHADNVLWILRVCVWEWRCTRTSPSRFRFTVRWVQITPDAPFVMWGPAVLIESPPGCASH